MNFEKYFEDLSLTAPIRTRVEEVLGQIRAACPEEIVDILISEYVQQDGSHIHQSVWAFSKNLVSEGGLLTGDSIRFDIVRLDRKVEQVTIDQRDFDWNAPARVQSRLTVDVRFQLMGLAAHMQASGPNCEVLRDIVKKYLAAGV
jgi:hypothetical protein